MEMSIRADVGHDSSELDIDVEIERIEALMRSSPLESEAANEGPESTVDYLGRRVHVGITAARAIFRRGETLRIFDGAYFVEQSDRWR